MGRGRLECLEARCMQAVESVATRLAFKEEANTLPLAVLRRCKRIEHIRCTRLRSLEGCPNGIKSLTVQYILSESLEHLSVCKELISLTLNRAGSISDLSPLSTCTKLKLQAVGCSKVIDLTPLSSMPLLEELAVFKGHHDPSIKDLAPLSHCKRLKMLNLGSNSDIDDLSPLRQCPDLEEVGLGYLHLIKDVSFLEVFKKLKTLSIIRFQVDDFSPLTRLPSLEELSCTNIPTTTSLLPLARCQKLKMVISVGYDSKDVDKLREKRPDTEIYG